MFIKELLHKLAKIENTRLIGVNTTENELQIELVIPQVFEGVQEDIQINRIVKEISKAIDEESTHKCSIKIKDGYISIKIPVSRN